MADVAEPRACKVCAIAKRRCDKQTPTCQRCKSRGLDCSYPPPKPSSFVILQPPTSTDNLLLKDAPNFPSPNIVTHQDGTVLTAPAPLSIDLITPCQHTVEPQPTDWFLLPETWQIIHKPIPIPDSLCSADFIRIVNVIQHNLESWVQTGSNSFIHSRLYSTRFPACAQVAYTTLSSYISRTESNLEVILKIIDDRASELLGIDGVELDSFEQDSGITATESLDVLDQLARVHALMVYQVIGLFDGNIRSRYLAEGRMQILDRWLLQMVECASCGIYPVHNPLNLLDMTDLGLPSPNKGPNNTENLWRAWILAESVRRTWQIGKGLQLVYLLLQQGWAYCPGGTMFTTREGVWEADSAFSWEKICAEFDVRLVQRFEIERHFTDASPADINEFGKMMLESTFGTERMEKWYEGYQMTIYEGNL